MERMVTRMDGGESSGVVTMWDSDVVTVTILCGSQVTTTVTSLQ
jgi:hypothetical protein